MYIISLSADCLTNWQTAECALSAPQSNLGAAEVIACRYEVARRSDQVAANDEQQWDLPPYPSDMITGTMISLEWIGLIT